MNQKEKVEMLSSQLGIVSDKRDKLKAEKEKLLKEIERIMEEYKYSHTDTVMGALRRFVEELKKEAKQG